MAGASHAASIKGLAGVSGWHSCPQGHWCPLAALVLCAAGISASALVLSAIDVSGALALGATLTASDTGADDILLATPVLGPLGDWLTLLSQPHVSVLLLARGATCNE